MTNLGSMIFRTAVLIALVSLAFSGIAHPQTVTTFDQARTAAKQTGKQVLLEFFVDD